MIYTDYSQPTPNRLPTLLTILGLSLLLIVAQKRHFFPQALHQALYSHIYSPVRSLIYQPLKALQSLSVQQQSEETLQQKVETLEWEKRELLAQLQLLTHYRAENRRLRLLMESIPEVTDTVLIAELRDTAIDGYTEQVTINKGKNQGVFINQAVIDPFGLVGQVVEVYPHEAKIMLISDARSRVPVYVERTQQRGLIAGGRDFGGLELNDLRLDSDIQVGDRLITSGLGGVFPRGYPVAVVTEVKRDQKFSFLKIKLQALAKLDSMLEVLLLASNQRQETMPIGPFVEANHAE